MAGVGGWAARWFQAHGGVDPGVMGALTLVSWGL